LTFGGVAGQAILVIDDDLGIRSFYQSVLQRAGFDVILAADGMSGLEILETREVGLVLCDVAMPGMSGFDVVRALRASPSTATLPIILIAGAADHESVIAALSAGADDFLAKPVRNDELVARVRAHIRTQAAWLDSVQQELRKRSSVVSMLARLQPSSDPEAMARAAIGELAARADVGFAAVFQVLAGSRGRILASTLAAADDTSSTAPSARRMRYLIDRASRGPWIEDIGQPEHGDPTNAFWQGGFEVLAGAPIFWKEGLVGILTMGRKRELDRPTLARTRDLLLATVIDYAAVLGAIIGPSLTARSKSQVEHRRLRRILANREFDVVFQPIIDLTTRSVVGFEALTRFADGVAPDVRFAEARAAGLATEFELAALGHAASQAQQLPADAFVGINVSPEVVLSSSDALRQMLSGPRQSVIEITEHVPIADYGALRDAIASLDGVQCAVDDAGAGFASMRHMLELQPTYAKLDISLVRGIHTDALRQALAAGLVYYAMRSGVRLIAEGVELDAEARMLQALGVEMAQGYLFGRPAPLLQETTPTVDVVALDSLVPPGAGTTAPSMAS
jgi:EAL domain-containing protein (putative c-di-GMP-specific phosphodiesterase class I)/FixJ family two-component response regulator